MRSRRTWDATHPPRSQRQDPQVGDASAREPARARDPPLRAVPAAVREAVRLRAVRVDLPADGRGRAPEPKRSHRDRRARAGDEPERATEITMQKHYSHNCAKVKG